MARKLIQDQIDNPPPMTDPLESEMRDGDYTFDTYREARRLSPYQPGDVFWVLGPDGKSARRALVLQSFGERTHYGDVRCVWRVRIETAKGRWANTWRYIYPGDVERGHEARKRDLGL